MVVRWRLGPLCSISQPALPAIHAIAANARTRYNPPRDQPEVTDVSGELRPIKTNRGANCTMTTTNRKYQISLILAGTIVMSLVPGCQGPESRQKKMFSPPRLTAVVMVDMLPNAFLDRYGSHLGEGGFKRLINEGAWMTNASVGYGAPNTASGHATLATGRYPESHGVVAYQWHKANLSDPISATTDSYYESLGLKDDKIGFGASPSKIIGGTLSSHLKEKHGVEARIWSVSLKQLAAVLLAGESADGAIWWESIDGQFISSNYYYDQMPGWLNQLNEERYVDAFFSDPWEHMLPMNAYKKSDADDVPYEQGPKTLWLNKMPKTLGSSLPTPNRIYYRQLRTSPFGNQLVFEAAKRAIVNESLGADATPDVIMLSLSSTDYCGYLFGPDSHEMADMFYRLDQQLADWFNFLDTQVGQDGYVVSVVADHGACPTPEFAQGFGKDAGRIDLNAVATIVEDALVDEFGSPGDQLYYLSFIDMPWVYLNQNLLELKGIDVDRADRVAANALARAQGIDNAIVCRDVVAKSESELTELERLVKRSHYPDRSGSIYVGLRDGWYPDNVTSGPLSANDYDTHIPMWLMGPGIKATTHGGRVTLPDLTATLRHRLAIPADGDAAGRVIDEVLE